MACPARASVLPLLLVSGAEEKLKLQACFLPDVVGAGSRCSFLTGTLGFLDIDIDSLPLTHSLLDSFFNSNFNYIAYLLFSSLIYSLPIIRVYHLSDWPVSPLRLV